MEIKTVHGSLDSASESCVLLYDFFGNSYAGEPTTNLFTQPTGNAGFVLKPVNTGRAFYKLDYTANLNGQGNFFDNAPGPFNKSDSIYKYNYVSGQTDSTSNRHGFNINVVRGETYTASVDVYVSTGHPRTGDATVLTLTPSTGAFNTISGSYDFDNKGTWQTISDKVYIPAVSNNFGNSAFYFEVAVATKTAQHPYFGSGSAQGFVVGNTQGRTLNLYKGATYVFLQSNITNADNEFYLTTTANSGGGNNAYSNNFSYYGNEGFDGYAVFTVPFNAPNILYYNSRAAGSSYFGGKINILGGYNSGNVGNTGNTGSSGTSGSSGNTGNLGQTTESYAVCFDPTKSELNGANLNGGYILYKNMQFEKNKPMFKGVTHKTKFTSSSRSPFNSLLDLTSSDNNSNLINAMYDSNALILFGNRTNLNDGGLVDINLKYNSTKTFSIGSAVTQTYDFWFTQTKASFQKAYLFSRSGAVSSGLFVENEGFPQLIYIQDKKIYFSFASPTGDILSGYTPQVIDQNTLYNVVICVNAYLQDGEKINIYVNGEEVSVTILTILQPPASLSFANVRSSVITLGNTGNIGFFNNATNFYCISSYDGAGESRASDIISVTSDPLKKSIQLSWPIVNEAFGYYLYRSSSPIFGNSSLLAQLTSKNILSFTDENSQARSGFPKTTAKYNFNYNKDVTSIVDNTLAKVCFGNYPITAGAPNYFEGYVYRIAIYNTQLTSTQVNRNYNSFLYKYISEDPSLINSSAKQRSVISGNTGTTGSAGSFRKVLE
jgi:hypothetical protein